MTKLHLYLVGWTLIGAVTALMFILDHFKMLNWHFNLFMVILLFVSTVLVAIIAHLGRSVWHQDSASKKDS